MACFKNLWMMMLRVKAPQLPPLAPKLSSNSMNVDTKKSDGNCFTNFALFCCAVSFGIIVLFDHIQESFMICVPVSGLCAMVSGLCLSEFLSNHAQNGYSVYSSSYHGVCELVAHIMGWTWMLSMGSCLASICMVLSYKVDELTNHQFSEFLMSNLSPDMPDVMSIIFVVSVLVISVSGVSYKMIWHAVSMPLALACGVSAYFLHNVLIFDGGDWKFRLPISFDAEKVLTASVLCSSAFIGCHSALRLPRFKFNRKLRTLLGPLNIANTIVLSSFGLLLLIAPGTLEDTDRDQDRDSKILVIATSLALVALGLLAIEYFHLLLVIVQDISADGLLFRCLSRQWKPFLHRIVVFRTGVLAAFLVALLTVLLPVLQVLEIAAAGILFMNLVVSLTILVQRYNYQDSWRYEPMLPNGTTTRHPSKTSGTEFSPKNSSDTPSGNNSASSSDSDEDNTDSHTDIDAVVQEYKDKMLLTEVPDLLSSNTRSKNLSAPLEPTSSTSFKSKMFVSCFSANCLFVGATVTVALRTGIAFDMPLASAIALTLVLSFVLLCLLYRLPENKKRTAVKKHSVHAPLMPWTAGLSVLLNSVLLIHAIVDIWHVLLTWSSIGLVLYLVHGVRNSTAASPFHSLTTKPAQVSMQPFPKEKTSCRLIYPQKRPKNKLTQVL